MVIDIGVLKLLPRKGNTIWKKGLSISQANILMSLKAYPEHLPEIILAVNSSVRVHPRLFITEKHKLLKVLMILYIK